MSGNFLSLNGTRVVSAHVSVPYYGTWTAWAMMPAAGNASALVAGSAVTLTLGNLTLTGSVYRSGPFAGQIKVFCMGGYGGWQKTVPAQQYALGGGLMLSTVLKDLAGAVSERVNVQVDRSLGSSFTREGTWAGKILRQIAGPLWYVDPSGTTQIASARPSLTIATPFQIITYDGDRGEFEIATEDYLSWLPGSSFSNEIVTTPQTVSLATIDTGNDGILRFKVLTVGPPTDRLIEDIRALVREEVEFLTFLGVYEYAVQGTDGSTVDAIPTSTDIPLPPLRKVTLRSGIPGTKVKPAKGSLLAVSFLNGDPTKPIVDPIYDSTKAQSVAFQGGSVGAARGGYDTLPIPDQSPPWPPAVTAIVPTGDQVIIAFTALDSGGNPLIGVLATGASLWDGMSSSEKSYYPPTPAGFLAAQSASASATPTGVGVGAITGFVATASKTVTVGN